MTLHPMEFLFLKDDVAQFAEQPWIDIIYEGQSIVCTAQIKDVDMALQNFIGAAAWRPFATLMAYLNDETNIGNRWGAEYFKQYYKNIKAADVAAAAEELIAEAAAFDDATDAEYKMFHWSRFALLITASANREELLAVFKSAQVKLAAENFHAFGGEGITIAFTRLVAAVGSREDLMAVITEAQVVATTDVLFNKCGDRDDLGRKGLEYIEFFNDIAKNDRLRGAIQPEQLKAYIGKVLALPVHETVTAVGMLDRLKNDIFSIVPDREYIAAIEARYDAGIALGVRPWSSDFVRTVFEPPELV